MKDEVMEVRPLRNKHRCFSLRLGLFIAILGLTRPAAILAENVSAPAFYKRPPVFAFRPAENRNGQSINRFGPVGIGIELTLPAFGMKIRNVEQGSPADRTGKLKAGQILETINGRKLADIDPRIQLGNIITEAEAGDGLVELVVRDAPDTPALEVTVRIPALGAYSPTWPLKCSKSDAIVRNLADSIRGKTYNGIDLSAGQAMLFMLSTGQKKDLDFVGQWVRAIAEKHRNDKEITVHNWTLGRCGMALCEYYLRTGDATVMPLITKLADCARWGMYNDGWAHGTYQGQRDRSKARMAFPYMGGGHINTCGVQVVAFLLMAKECGADVHQPTLQASLRHFFRFAARGNVAYGDQIPEQSFVDNGKTGALAFAMQAATNLTPGGEKTVYAAARDRSAVKGFYSTSWMLIGHTGGGVGEIWRSASMGLMADREEKKYREFMDNRRWFYELSRRFDGSFGIIGGGNRYDRESWGVMMGLTYTAPRKTLRLTGAPKTEFSRSFKLPDRPWGNAADDVFYSGKPATGLNGESYTEALEKETLATGSSRAAFAVMGNPQVDDATLLQYAHHPDHGIRRGAASFIWRHERDHLIARLLQSKDPRVRHAGTMAIHCRFKRRPLPPDRLTDEMVDLLAKMIQNPNEAWWGAENAMKALAIARPDQIAPNVERLLYFLNRDDWWLSAAAMVPLARIVDDERFYKRILSDVGKIMANDTHLSRISAAAGVFASVKNAGPEIQAYAVDVLSKTYRDFPTAAELHDPDQISMEPAENKVLSDIFGMAGQFPKGFDALFASARKRYPDQVLPHSRLLLRQKPERLAPEIREAIEAFKAEKQ